MKKLIALSSTGLAAVFAIAVANADDTTTTTTTKDTSQSVSGDTMNNQEAGSMGTDTSGTSGMSSDTSNTPSTTGKSTETMTRSWKKTDKSKTCTDENGVTYYHGKSGFDRCMDAKHKMDTSSGADTSMRQGTTGSESGIMGQQPGQTDTGTSSESTSSYSSDQPSQTSSGNQ